MSLCVTGVLSLWSCGYLASHLWIIVLPWTTRYRFRYSIKYKGTSEDPPKYHGDSSECVHCSFSFFALSARCQQTKPARKAATVMRQTLRPYLYSTLPS